MNERTAAGDYNGALNELNGMLQFPENYKAYFTRGKIFFTMGRYQEAINDFDTMIFKDSLHIESYLYRGISKADLKRYEEAIYDYNKAIFIDPYFEVAYVERGEAYIEIKRNKEACLDFKKAYDLGYVKIGPDLEKYCK